MCSYKKWNTGVFHRKQDRNFTFYTDDRTIKAGPQRVNFTTGRRQRDRLTSQLTAAHKAPWSSRHVAALITYQGARSRHGLCSYTMTQWRSAGQTLDGDGGGGGGGGGGGMTASGYRPSSAPLPPPPPPPPPVTGHGPPRRQPVYNGVLCLAALNGVAALAPTGRMGTPSPPEPDLPPLRHLSKVKRFLTTLQKFGPGHLGGGWRAGARTHPESGGEWDALWTTGVEL